MSDESEQRQRHLDEQALRLASGNGNLFHLDNVLKLGANANARDADGQTVLHKTVHSEYSHHVAKVALEHGAGINAVDYEGKTALHYAAQKNHPSTVEMLILHGADQTIRDAKGRTAEAYAPLDSQAEMKFQMAKPDYDGRFGELGDTSLHRAARKGDEDLVGVKLMSQDIGINNLNFKGESALHLLPPSSPQSARLLVGRGANPHLEDKHGRSAMSMQTPENRDAMMKGLEDQHRFEYERQQAQSDHSQSHSQQHSIPSQGRSRGGFTR